MLQAEYILDLQKQLTLISSEARRESNGNLALEVSIPSMTTIDKVCSELSFMHQCFILPELKFQFEIHFTCSVLQVH